MLEVGGQTGVLSVFGELDTNWSYMEGGHLSRGIAFIVLPAIKGLWTFS